MRFKTNGGQLGDGYTMLIFNIATATPPEIADDGRIIWDGPKPERRVVGRYNKPGQAGWVTNGPRFRGPIGAGSQ